MDTNQASPAEQNKQDRLELATADMLSILNETGGMFHKLKQIKFDYLVKTCDIYTKIDLPTIMMTNCEKELKQLVPPAENIRRMNL